MILEEQVVSRLLSLNKKIVFAESCTGGQLASRISAVPGASAVLWGSYVCYTAEAKHKMLSIHPGILNRYGLVSRETVIAMADAAIELSGADLSVAVSGLLGPDGDGSEVPVGDVWLAITFSRRKCEAFLNHYAGTRLNNRDEITEDALNLVLKSIT